MTDRLAEFRRGEVVSSVSLEYDPEAGLDDESERLLAEFSREADVIAGVLDRARTKTERARSARPEEREAELAAAEAAVRDARRRLKKLAEENKTFKRKHANRPATVTIRVNRYTQLGHEFGAVTQRLAEARELERAEQSAALQRAVLRANPAASEQAVADAIESGAPQQLDAVLLDERSGAATHELADMRARNAAIQDIVRGVAELNDIFQDMSILVETQQNLLNEVEFNIEDTKQQQSAAVEELGQAHAHQKSRNRKKKWCIIILVLIVAIIVLILLLRFVVFRPRQ